MVRTRGHALPEGLGARTRRRFPKNKLWNSGDRSKAGTTARLHTDVVIVLRGRSIGGVFFIGALKRVPRQEPIVARVAARLR